jgi:DNA repair protein RadD
MIQLRPYQERAITMLRACYSAGRRAPCLVMPTAAGKTVVVAAVAVGAVARGKPVLFLADRTELIDQTVDKLRRAGVLDVRVIQEGEDRGSPTAPITVASVETLRMPRWKSCLPEAKLVIADECHGFLAGSYSYLLSRYPGALLLGLTATPARRDGKPLGDVFDELVVPTSVRELTELGYLAPCQVWAGPPDLKPGELALTPLEAYQRHGHGELAAVYCRDRKHAQAELEAFRAAGIAADIVDGTLAPARRRVALAAWAAGETRVVTSVGCLTTGFDLPALAVAILARRFTHATLWLQVCGRVLRTHPGKTLARVIDLGGSAHLHGPPDLDRTYSLTGKAISTIARDSFGQCRACGSMFRSGPSSCPHCGAVLPVHARALPRSTGAGVTELRGPAPRQEFVVTISSKYAGRCAACGQPYQRGEKIRWATLARVAKHRVCPVAATATEATP